MEPLLKMESTRANHDETPLHWSEIHVLMFNYDARGSALCRCFYPPKRPVLLSYSGEDLEIALGIKGGFYHEAREKVDGDWSGG